MCRPIKQIGLLQFFDITDDPSMEVGGKFSKFILTLEVSYLKAFPQKIYLSRSNQPGNTSWFTEDLRRMREYLEVSRQYKRPADAENDYIKKLQECY